jgi:RNA polymerase sigma factor (sigma-70 family)
MNFMLPSNKGRYKKKKTYRNPAGEWYQEYSTMLFLTVYAKTRDKELSEDAVHNVFCRLLVKLEKNKTSQVLNIKSYLAISVTREAITLLRKKLKRESIHAEAFELSQISSLGEIKSLIHESVDKEIEEILNEKEYQVFLRWKNNYKNVEIAEELGLPINHVYQLVFRMRRKLSIFKNKIIK